MLKNLDLETEEELRTALDVEMERLDQQDLTKYFRHCRDILLQN